MSRSPLRPLNPREYLVLLYHGVHADGLELAGRNSSGKHISASRFRRQMEVIARDWNLVTMSDIREALSGEHRLPPRAVAVTFDDGFADVYHHARPVLSELGMRATFYLTTGFIGTGRMSWTDQLEDTILRARPGMLLIKAEGRELACHLSDVDSRVEALTRIKAACKKMSFRQVAVVLEQIGSQSGITPDPSHPLYEMLDWDRVREMGRDGTFEFGAHTVDHIPLSRVPYEEMARQVSESLATVSEEIGTPTRLFSYPEGQADDYDETSVNYLKSIGLDLCPTAIDGVNKAGVTDPFHIYRCMIGFEGRPFILG